MMECIPMPLQVSGILKTGVSTFTSTEEAVPSSQRSKTRRRSSISQVANHRIKMVANPVKEQVHIRDRDVNFHVQSFASNPDGTIHIVKICDSLTCTCEDFNSMLAKRKFTPCKHMYFVYVVVLGLDIDNNTCIHQPHLSLIELF
ncbi:hypothetical protein O6H91_04G126600 [Diphasiastrum complanatum]|uniref:Uncharacterized protein n=1 Tax=Diphasiastrum complanatum TaxID=34168 RepID=A0ACC2E1T1_DIPCM|nr:hypothetical protein O6H91_04G126600 [Diphasiastrum complanatum]